MTFTGSASHWASWLRPAPNGSHSSGVTWSNALCAFKTVKQYILACAPHCHGPLDYGPDCDPIWIMTDVCGNRIGGVVAQGHDWKGVKVVAFYSTKMSPAQRNYPVHTQEWMVGIETMLRHQDILQGIRFALVTDHKSLAHILDQKGLSGHQAC